MHSAADSGDGSYDADHLATEGRANRVQWEIEELVAAGLLLTIGVLALSDIASGWANASVDSNRPASQALRSFLLYSTDWSGISAGFLILAALGLIWWQMDGWAERLEDLDTGEEGQATLREFEEAARHLARNRSLSTACGILLVVGLIASVGAVVGEVIVGYGGYGQTALFWGQVLRPVGELVGFLILAAIGMLAIVGVRATCDRALNAGEEGPTLAESPGAG